MVVSFVMRTMLFILMVSGLAGCSEVRHPAGERVPTVDSQDSSSKPESGFPPNTPSSTSDGGMSVDDPPLQYSNKPSNAANQTILQDSLYKPWPFRPARVRIHPLSHFTVDESGQSRGLYLRLEFFDRFEHNTKGIGTIEFELFVGSEPSETIGFANRLEVWVSDINDLDRNLERYDDVTRTYLFPLMVNSDLELPEKGQLVVTVLTQDQVLRDDIKIRLK